MEKINENVYTFPIKLQNGKNELLKLEHKKYYNSKICKSWSDKTDLVPGIYEGGIKLWECSVDLTEYLSNILIKEDLTNKKVLELGCGHGYPGLFFLYCNSIVTFQDLNKEVLDIITYENIEILMRNNNLKFEENNNFYLADGDWGSLKFKDKFDIIVSSDTIYNIENYERFHDVILNSLNIEGICYICCKYFYFGVGGGYESFIEFIEKKGVFIHKELNRVDNGFSNIRIVFSLKFKS